MEPMEMTTVPSVSADTRPRVYDFLNYREFLYRYYEFRKSKQKGYSFTVFARAAGMKTPNLLIMIVNNRRNLTDTNLAGISQACGFNEDETKYFSTLVKWNQELDPALRAQYETIIKRLIPKKSYKELVNEHLKIIRKWYGLALLEMVNLKDFVLKTSWIQSRLSANLSEQDIYDTYRNLLKLGLISRNDESVEKTFDTTLFKSDIPSDVICEFHGKNIEFALKRLKEVPMENRRYTTTTFSLNQKDYDTVKKMTEDFQTQLLDYVQNCSKGEEVYQCNVQLFPVTKIDKRD